MQLPCFVLLQDCWIANWAFSWPNPLAASLPWEGLEAHNMELLLEFFHGLGMIPRQTGENQKCLQLCGVIMKPFFKKRFKSCWIYWAMLGTMALTKDSMKVPPGVVGVHHHNRDWCGYRRQPPSAIGFATSNRCRLTCPPRYHGAGVAVGNSGNSTRRFCAEVSTKSWPKILIYWGP